jgi:hypothetical protein
MATIRNILNASDRQELYALKDQMSVLSMDPMKMNRTQFTRYLKAKAEALVRELTGEGIEVEAAFRKTEMYLTLVDSEWREEAKRLNTVVKLDMVDVTS